MNSPLVSVICLCHNHNRFVEEAIQSILDQTYANVELIIVDDASTDCSASVIADFIRDKPAIKFRSLPQNVGNCRAFNEGLKLSTGEFIIDHAADDVLLPERIAKGVDHLQNLGDKFGVTFSDAFIISEDGKEMGKHSDRFPHVSVPHGDIYRNVIERFFICSPTMMFRRSVIDELHGYDENLSYEDFDFWVRSSRNYYYGYIPEPLVKKRVVRNSMTQKQFSIFSRQQDSTYLVCEKIMMLNRHAAEQKALTQRLRYEVVLSVRQLNFYVAMKFIRLLYKNSKLRYS